MFHIDVHLLDTRNGKQTIVSDTYVYPGNGLPTDDDESNFIGIEHYWTEGSFGCDCNRSLCVEGVEVGCNMGDNLIQLQKIVVRETGAIIYSYAEDI